MPTTSTTFRPGHPKAGGRAPGVPNKVTKDVAAICQALTLGNRRFLKAIKNQLDQGACHPTIVVRLIEYGYGKPVERVAPPPPEGASVDLEKLTDEEIEFMERIIRKAGIPSSLPPSSLGAPADDLRSGGTALRESF